MLKNQPLPIKGTREIKGLLLASFSVYTTAFYFLCVDRVDECFDLFIRYLIFSAESAEYQVHGNAQSGALKPFSSKGSHLTALKVQHLAIHRIKFSKDGIYFDFLL